LNFSSVDLPTVPSSFLTFASSEPTAASYAPCGASAAAD
jgi:hypothetical protein